MSRRSYVFNLQLLCIELCTIFVYQTNNNNRVTVWLLTWGNNTWNYFENTEPVLSHWLIICLAIEISCRRVARGYSNCWRLWRLLEAAVGCRRGPQYDRSLSILIVIFLYNSNKLRPETESCAVAQTLLVYKKLIQTANKLCTIEGGKPLLGDWAWPLNDRLSTSTERSIKCLHSSTKQLVKHRLSYPETMSYPRPKMHHYFTSATRLV